MFDPHEIRTVEIVQHNPSRADILIDGERVKGVTGFRVEGEIHDRPSVTVTLRPWSLKYTGPIELDDIEFQQPTYSDAAFEAAK